MLVLLYSVTLVKVCRGSGYRLVIVLILLLIISNLAMAAQAILSIGTFVDKTTSATIAVDVMIAVTYYLFEVTFAVTHWALASNYKMIAKEMPVILDGGQIDQAQKDRRNKEYKILLALNILAPTMEMAVGIPLNIALFTGSGQPAPSIAIAAIVFPTFSQLMQVISGTVLISSVVKIRRFYFEKNIEQQLNTGKLLLHASAFGLYLISIVIYYASWDLFLLTLTDKKLEAVTVFLFFVFYVVAAIAQVLLCAIFWELAMPDPTRFDTESSSNPILTESLNESFEVQARIWNQFMRLSGTLAESSRYLASSLRSN